MATVRILGPDAGTVAVIDSVCIHARVLTTTSGTIDTATVGGTWTPSGVSVVKTGSEVGRYTFTLGGYTRLLNVNICPFGPTDAAWGANTTGGTGQVFIRNDNVSLGTKVNGSTGAGTVDVQFKQTSNADAEIPDGTGFYVTFWVARGATF